MRNWRTDPARRSLRQSETAVSLAPHHSGADVVFRDGARRHDLDALRGVAMLLGIGLHASLAFFPAPWAVQDSTVDPTGYYDEFFHAVHGFRMPMFFLLSGFFTAMLRRRRGLASLVRQRSTRVLVPLIIGAITIVPLVRWVVEQSAASPAIVATSPDIVTAIVYSDIEAVEQFIESGYDLETRGQRGGTVLHLAAVLGSGEVVEALLEAGADPSAATFDGATPLDAAVAYGNWAAADALVDHGVRDRRSAGQVWSDIEGWGVLTDADSLTNATGFTDSTSAPADIRERHEFWAVSLYHLWYLWFLCLLTAGFVAACWLSELLAGASQRKTPLTAAATSSLLGGLIVVTWPAQYLMGDRGQTRVFGPDTSAGPVPELHVLAYYAIFFGFGALMYGARGRRGAQLVDTIGRRWWLVLPITLVILFPLALLATFGDGGSGTWAWATATMLQAIYAWGMVIGLIGLFRAALSVERRGIRYLADSSYWLYLAHLPLVIAGQAWIRDWDVPASAKFFGLCALSALLLLASYELIVRHTPIGWLLNGRRSRHVTTSEIGAGGR